MLDLGKISVCGVKTVTERHRINCGVFRLLKKVPTRGRVPRTGTLFSTFRMRLSIRPPMTRVSLSRRLTMVLAFRLEISGMAIPETPPQPPPNPPDTLPTLETVTILMVPSILAPPRFAIVSMITVTAT